MEEKKEDLIIDEVLEGGVRKPFYRLVYHNMNKSTSIFMPVGLHLLGKLYIWLAYRRGNIHKSFRLVTTMEWERQNLDGYNEAMRDMGEGEVTFG